MKYAVISVSKEGALLGQRVLGALPGGEAFERRGEESGGAAILFQKTLPLTDEIFSRFDGLLYIMASGIAVRAIAPHVASKTSDPAVLVMDECGKHCISLLSGHLGGANDWARDVALVVGAEPVITTATDAHGRASPDALARKCSFRVEPVEALKAVNAAIAKGEPFGWFVDPDGDDAEYFLQKLKEEGAAAEYFSEEKMETVSACAVLTERNVPVSVPHVFLRPKNCFLGIGCKRGTSEDLIAEAVRRAMASVGIRMSQVKSLASVDKKSDEEGLLAFAEDSGLPIHFYSAETLRKTAEKHHLETSSFVQKEIGVGNVCEAAALTEAPSGRTLLAKTKFPSVTVAMAVGLSGSSASDRATKRK